MLQSCKIKTFYLGSDYLASVEVLKQNSFTQNKLSLLIRIDDFPSFVASKGRCFTRDIDVNNTWWYICISLDKWCETRERYTALTPESSDQPDILSACIWGNDAENRKICSFDVAAIFKFKQLEAVEEIKLIGKFHFNPSNENKHNSDFPILAKIEVIFLSYRIVYFI